MSEILRNRDVDRNPKVSDGAPNCADQQAALHVGLPVGAVGPSRRKDAGALTSMTRRDLLRGAIRAAGAAALAVVTGALVRRNLRAGPSAAGGEPACDNRFICRGCGRLESCGLPQALSARQALGGRRAT